MKLTYVSVSPIQNVKPFRVLAQTKGIELEVLYLKDAAQYPSGDKEDITKAAFNHDLLSGYPNRFLQNKSPFKKKEGFLSSFCPSLWKAVKNSDVIVIHGHYLLSFWVAIAAAKVFRKKLVLTTDATYIQGNAESHGLKLKIKPLVLRFLYNGIANNVFVTSTASKLFLISVGIRPEKIVLMPYVVDEDLILNRLAETDMPAFARSHQIDPSYTHFVFCAKFIPRKRPLDAILALSKIKHLKARLIMIGEGPLMGELKATVEKEGLQDAVYFPGLVQYTELPLFYGASDALVFCSEHEPYGLPVNEAMICSTPAIVSNMIGARLDLVEDGKTGWIYPVGDIDALANIMQQVVEDKTLLNEVSMNAAHKMDSWSSISHVHAVLDFLGMDRVSA